MRRSYNRKINSMQNRSSPYKINASPSYLTSRRGSASFRLTLGMFALSESTFGYLLTSDVADIVRMTASHILSCWLTFLILCQIFSHLEVVLRQNQNLKSENVVLKEELKTLHGLTEESEVDGESTRNKLQAIAKMVNILWSDANDKQSPTRY